jgi:hypothetical protein
MRDGAWFARCRQSSSGPLVPLVCPRRPSPVQAAPAPAPTAHHRAPVDHRPRGTSQCYSTLAVTAQSSTTSTYCPRPGTAVLPRRPLRCCSPGCGRWARALVVVLALALVVAALAAAGPAAAAAAAAAGFSRSVNLCCCCCCCYCCCCAAAAAAASPTPSAAAQSRRPVQTTCMARSALSRRCSDSSLRARCDAWIRVRLGAG